MDFVWQGKPLDTYRDVMDVLLDIIENGSRDDAHAFMEAYKEITPYAYSNVGYLAGYYDPPTTAKILDWCETAHPIFGRTTPTFEEAYDAGLKVGASLKAGS